MAEWFNLQHPPLTKKRKRSFFNIEMAQPSQFDYDDDEDDSYGNAWSMTRSTSTFSERPYQHDNEDPPDFFLDPAGDAEEEERQNLVVLPPVRYFHVVDRRPYGPTPITEEQFVRTLRSDMERFPLVVDMGLAGELRAPIGQARWQHVRASLRTVDPPMDQSGRQTVLLFFNLPFTYVVSSSQPLEMIRPRDRRYLLGVLVIMFRLAYEFRDYFTAVSAFVERARSAEGDAMSLFQDAVITDISDGRGSLFNVPVQIIDAFRVPPSSTTSIGLRVYITQQSRELYESLQYRIIQDVQREFY